MEAPPELNSLDMINLLTMNALENQSQELDGSMLGDAPMSPATNAALAKRRRLRRHPVWSFFGDVDEERVKCKRCEFTTKSGYTTNLKMHLKSHHKQDFIEVSEREVEQMVREGDAAGDDGAGGKRRRRTIAEIQESIEKCKRSMLGKGKAAKSAMAELAKLNDFDISMPFDQSDQQNTEMENNDAVANILNLLMQSNASQQEQQQRERSAALTELVGNFGPQLLKNKAFRRFVTSLDPNYDLPEEVAAI